VAPGVARGLLAHAGAGGPDPCFDLCCFDAAMSYILPKNAGHRTQGGSPESTSVVFEFRPDLTGVD
jgi:hypothetical protein